MYSDTGNTTSLVLGFPIRTSSDPRSVGSSPRHIAASHVLHRPLMPRHPPCALKHLQQKHKNQKTIQRKLHHNKPTPTNAKSQPPQRESTHTPDTNAGLMLATTIHESNTTPHHQAGQQHTSPPAGKEQRACCLRTQQCVWQFSFDRRIPEGTSRNQSAFVACAPEPHPLQTGSISRIARLTELPHDAGGSESRGAP